MPPADLLEFLATRGGQEYRVVALLRSGRGKRAVVRELGEYRLTVRGEAVQATGPSGQTRLLTPAEFLDVFRSSEFGPAEPTGVMTDLGPLFAS